MIVPDFCDLLIFRDFEVYYKNFELCTLYYKIFVIIVKFMKIQKTTKISDHVNLELYSIANT